MQRVEYNDAREVEKAGKRVRVIQIGLGIEGEERVRVRFQD